MSKAKQEVKQIKDFVRIYSWHKNYGNIGTTELRGTEIIVVRPWWE